MVTDDLKIAKIFNDYFANMTQDLEITDTGAQLSSTTGIDDHIDKAVEKCKSHPSIKKIKECFTCSESIHFRQVTAQEVFCQLRKLNPRKSSPVGSIPAKVMKGSKVNKGTEKSTESDRSRLNWTINNPNWYPAIVREGRSENLTNFIDNLLKDIKDHLEQNQNKKWNNLTDGQRKSLNALSSDDSLTIKPADKGNGIVIMDKNVYHEACLKILSDKSYYEEVPEDPNPKYRKELDEIISEMNDLDYIGETEETRLREGSRTPCFYGLPKIHKSCSKFQPLRPICSGFMSCTARLSEWVDRFLKPAAMKTKSYIKETTHFVLHIESLNDKEINLTDVFLVTMDVASLYPKISHQEGIFACEKALEQRKVKSIPSSFITKLISFILTSNTMRFLDKYYHQIKGTAMGTPMAVNYANLFMSAFEDQMIDA